MLKKKGLKISWLDEKPIYKDKIYLHEKIVKTIVRLYVRVHKMMQEKEVSIRHSNTHNKR